MIGYVQKFAPQQSEKEAPLKQLVKKNVHFHGKAPQQIKVLSQSPVLKFFNPRANKVTVLLCCLHFFVKDGVIVLCVHLGTFQYWWILRFSVFCPLVWYLSFFCKAFSWIVLDSSSFPLFHSSTCERLDYCETRESYCEIRKSFYYLRSFRKMKCYPFAVKNLLDAVP